MPMAAERTVFGPGTRAQPRNARLKVAARVGCGSTALTKPLICKTFSLRMQRYDKIPDVRDGLTREERVVLYVLHEAQKERGDRNVPTAMLWGRVCEHFYISPEDLSAMLARLGARK
jgi:hypothetical protein